MTHLTYLYVIVYEIYKKKESNRVDQKTFLSDEYTLDWSHFLLDENTVVSWSGRWVSFLFFALRRILIDSISTYINFSSSFIWI